MKIGIVGCVHGCLNELYAAVAETEKHLNEKIDVILCCGDFQAVRNPADLSTMSCPAKYRHLGAFHEYYYGNKVAPYLTIFVGGNHEASNHCQELPYGGWVAPNIYYMGYVGCIKLGNLTIGGISGIFGPRDYMKGRFEEPPYEPDTLRSVYHIRKLDINRLCMLPKLNADKKIDIFLSHDWPTKVVSLASQGEDVHGLLRKKPFFMQDIQTERLGCKPLNEVLSTLRPKYWFAAHLHVKYATIVRHNSDTFQKDPDEINLLEDNSDDEETKKRHKTSSSNDTTRFLCLDKIIPGRDFFQVISIPEEAKDAKLYYDLDWLAIIKATHVLTPVTVNPNPNLLQFPRANLLEAKDFIEKKFPRPIEIPYNFQVTALPSDHQLNPSGLNGNPQTDEFFKMLEIPYFSTSLGVPCANSNINE